MRAAIIVFLIQLLTGSLSLASPQLDSAGTPAETSDIPSGDGPSATSRAHALIRGLIVDESAKSGLPPDIAEAVVYVESAYNPAAIGEVGEIGLMQVRPETAAMLGFRGSLTDLSKPEVNLHYGIIYLAEAWRLAGGDLCRALMKYRAGHGEERMSPRSVNYCARARDRLAALHSSFATAVSAAYAPDPINPLQGSGTSNGRPTVRPIRARDAYSHYKQGTPAASQAFWTVHEARIRAMTRKLESRWHAASR
jgi:hypothetical protein